MHTINQLLLLIALVSICLMLPVYAETNVNDNLSRDETQFYHVFDDVYLVSTLKLIYGRPRIVVKSVFPQLQSDSEKMGIATFNQLVIECVKEEMDNYQNRVNQSQEIQRQIARSRVRNNLYIDYDTSVIEAAGNHITSIRFSIKGIITGKARPYHYHRGSTISIDLSHLSTLSFFPLRILI